MRRSGDELDDLLGDNITEGLPRIVAGMFDGDTEALLNMIADHSVDEYVRDALFGAATFLAWEGRIERDRLADFLEHFRRQRLAPDRDFGWVGCQRAVALLGLNHLAPQVHEAFWHGRICKTIMSRSDFDGDLDAALGDPASVSRFKTAHLGYIDDVLVELEFFDRPFEDHDTPDWSRTPGSDSMTEPIIPAVNPWRGVGRNDPCPCGSGKKAKKCCLAG